LLLVKDQEGDGYDLFQDTTQHYPRNTKKHQSKIMAGSPVEIRI